MKLTCPNCKREHTLREPYPAPTSRIACPCGRRLAVQYPPGMVEQLRKRGAAFEGDVPAGNDPFQSAGVQHGGYWKAGVDDEATSLFSPDQIEAAAQRARGKGSLIPEAPPPQRAKAAPDLRRVPDHGPTAMFPFAEPPTHRPASPPPAAPGKGSSFEEEPTALFMADGEISRVNLKDIPDHGRTGMVYPVSREEVGAPPRKTSSPVGMAATQSEPEPPPRAPTPATPVGRAAPAVMEAPPPPHPPRAPPPILRSAAIERPPAPRPPPDPGPIVVERDAGSYARPAAPLASVVPIEGAPSPSPASSLEPVAASQPASADQAFPETASGVRRGATLDEIMRLKVTTPAPEPVLKGLLPKAALALLIVLGLAAVLAVAAMLATVVLR